MHFSAAQVCQAPLGAFRVATTTSTFIPPALSPLSGERCPPLPRSPNSISLSSRGGLCWAAIMHELGTSDSVETTPLARAQSPYDLLRNRDVAVYLIGRLVGSMGQQMLTMAVGWEVYERTGSTLALGLVCLTQMGPMVVFTLPAGQRADE